ncbi:MAG: TorF family putative porin, partial [Azonexus sp.]|nr:TorF family putative porin [Azonexus sp.]
MNNIAINFRLAGLALLLLAATNIAQADSAFTTSGSLTLVSNYLGRGMTLTQNRPTVQGAIEIAHSNGWYGGIFGSGVSNAAYPNAAGSEIDLMTGWRFSLPADLGLDLGYYAYFYPGAHSDDGIRYNTQEVKATLSRDTFSIGAGVVSSHYFFGTYDYDASGNPKKGRGSLYLEANWNPVLAEGVTLNLHAAHQSVRHSADYNFADYKIGVTVDGQRLGLPGWSAALAWTYNDGDRVLWTFVDSDGS